MTTTSEGNGVIAKSELFRDSDGTPALLLHDDSGEVCSHRISEEQLIQLLIQAGDLLAAGRSAAAAVYNSPGRTRERELPALRANKAEHIAAWSAKHGGGDAA